MTELVDVVLGGTFHAAVLFLVAAGLQLVLGVQKIVNLACGSFYALGAYFGITAVGLAIRLGMPPALFLPVLIVAGLAIGIVGLPIERVLRTVYRRDESYQLLITFGFLLMFQDVFRFLWGATPRTMDNVYMAYGTANFLGVRVPTYNLLVIAASLAIAAGLDMAVELVVESFAVVVIGGLGSMRGALVGALVVGWMRAAAISLVPEMEMLSVYLVVVIVLIVRPAGLFGKATA